MEMYAQFQDCLDQHKGHAFLAIGGLTIPWSIYRRSIAPLVIGTILAFVPDMVYANYRCDGHYKKFKAHVQGVLGSSGGI
jgi:hypothetical protein